MIISIIFIILVIVSSIIAKRRRAQRPTKIGIEGELSVSTQLTTLPADYTTINNVVLNLESLDKTKAGICPWCGGKLVKRTGLYESFYGCSNYPKCKFIQK